MSTYEVFEVDPDAVEHGVLITTSGGTFRVRSVKSKIVRKLQAELEKQNRQASLANGGTLPPDVQDRTLVEVLARGIVGGWEADVTGRDGKPLAHNVENARALFKDLPELREELIYGASVRESYRRAALEALKGNSVAPSEPGSQSVGA